MADTEDRYIAEERRRHALDRAMEHAKAFGRDLDIDAGLIGAAKKIEAYLKGEDQPTPPEVK